MQLERQALKSARPVILARRARLHISPKVSTRHLQIFCNAEAQCWATVATPRENPVRFVIRRGRVAGRMLSMSEKINGKHRNQRQVVMCKKVLNEYTVNEVELSGMNRNLEEMAFGEKV
jgi:hypothetical protein